MGVRMIRFIWKRQIRRACFFSSRYSFYSFFISVLFKHLVLNWTSVFSARIDQVKHKHHGYLVKTCLIYVILCIVYPVFSRADFKTDKCLNSFLAREYKHYWMSYKEAKEFIRSEGVKSSIEFRKWRQSNFRPANFPTQPSAVYKEEWEGWKSFLGNEWMSYKEAKEFIKSEGVKSSIKFRKWRQSNFRPANFPSKPDKVYKEEWEGWKSFLGNEWMSYKEAKEFIRSEGVKSSIEFRKWRQSDFRPASFPTKPDEVYKKEWEGWKSFLGNEWMSYKEAKEFIRNEGVKSSIEFRKWRQSDFRPVNFPAKPDKIYKEEWEGWKSFLGNEWMSYKEAKEFIRSEGIKSSIEFRKWRQSDFRPANFPTQPSVVYKEEWEGWKLFLGLSNNPLNFELK